MKRSEIEQRELDRIHEEEQKELQQKHGQKNPESETSSFAANKNSFKSKSKEEMGEEQKIDDLVLPKVEVIRRLRFLKQPITLFGEDDDARLDRLKSLLKARIMELDSDMTEGQRNDFLQDLAKLKKRQKTGILNLDRKKEDNDGGEGGSGGGSDDHGGEGAFSSGIDIDKDLK